MTSSLNAFKHAWQEYERNFCTCFRFTLAGRTKRYLKTQDEAVIDTTMDYLFNHASVDTPSRQILKRIRDELDIQHNSRDPRIIIPRGYMTSAQATATWYRHVPEVIRMLFRIEQFNIEHANDEGFEQLPLFVVVPQSTSERIHITIDTDGLIQIINSFRPRGQKIHCFMDSLDSISLFLI